MPRDCCTSCGVELTRVFDDVSQQYDNALEVIFSGGYSMFFDDGDRRVFLCHDCAHELCDMLPWLAQLIQPQHSHAHLSEYWEAHPEHDGWDKPSAEQGKL